jgi:hypothetical protein
MFEFYNQAQFNILSMNINDTCNFYFNLITN